MTCFPCASFGFLFPVVSSEGASGWSTYLRLSVAPAESDQYSDGGSRAAGCAKRVATICSPINPRTQLLIIHPERFRRRTIRNKEVERRVARARLPVGVDQALQVRDRGPQRRLEDLEVVRVLPGSERVEVREEERGDVLRVGRAEDPRARGRRDEVQEFEADGFKVWMRWIRHFCDSWEGEDVPCTTPL